MSGRHAARDFGDRHDRIRYAAWLPCHAMSRIIDATARALAWLIEHLAGALEDDPPDGGDGAIPGEPLVYHRCACAACPCGATVELEGTLCPRCLDGCRRHEPRHRQVVRVVEVQGVDLIVTGPPLLEVLRDAQASAVYAPGYLVRTEPLPSEPAVQWRPRISAGRIALVAPWLTA